VRRPHRTWPQRLLLSLNIALVVVCLVAAGGVYWTYSQASALPRIDVGASLSPSTEPGEPKNILLVGIDDGTGLESGDPVLRGRTESLNTDTVMILRVDPQTEQAALLSLPRDLYVDLAGGGLIETIKQDFGIPINHYAMVDFHGFEEMVNSVGGVPIYFNHPSRDRSSGLFQYDPGCVTLDGTQALAYARSRHFEIQTTENGRWQEDPSSDLGRIARQQQFIKAALRKAVAQGVRNPFVLRDLLGIAQENVTLDTELSIQELLDLGMQFRNFDPDQLVTYTPPADGEWVGQMSVLVLDDAGAEPIFDVFRGVAPIPADPTSVTSTTEAPTTTTTAPGGRPSSTTSSSSTTTTINEFLPRVPEGESCG
jgi:LCP family protein required for cell wall assembly